MGIPRSSRIEVVYEIINPFYYYHKWGNILIFYCLIIIYSNGDVETQLHS